MTMPVTALEWLWFLVKVMMGFVPASLIWWLWREMTAHSLYLYAQRTSEKHESVATYRLAVQNNEDVPLGEHTLRVRILDDHGVFTGSPSVNAGCNRFTPKMEDDRRSWQMTFAELPPYDTWSIDCAMTAQARNIELEVGESGTRLTGSKLMLAADQVSILTGRRAATEWWWAVLATLVAIGVYAAVITFWFEKFDESDWWFGAAISVFGGLLYVLSQTLSARVAPPVTQGYWDPTKSAGVVPDHLAPGPSGL